jgi:hypothetical protein
MFTVDSAHALKRDVPGAKLVMYNGSHFLLEEYAPDMAKQILQTFN